MIERSAPLVGVWVKVGQVVTACCVLAALTTGEAQALSSGSGSKVFFQREVNRRAARPAVPAEPVAAETAPLQPRHRKKHRAKS